MTKSKRRRFSAEFKAKVALEAIEGMRLMMQQDIPDDYVLATGEMHSVREFVELAFEHVGYTIKWSGSGVDEIGIDEATGTELVKIDPRYFRPTEVEQLLGDATKARQILGWEPKLRFAQLVEEMVESDLAAIAQEQGRKDRSAV